MNELDWAIIIVLVLSTVVGVTRGVVREILSIVGWVIGIVFAIRFSPELAGLIPLESLGPANSGENRLRPCYSDNYCGGLNLRGLRLCYRTLRNDFAQDA